MPEIRAELDERYRYVLVDEYQDTNRAQYVILRALSTDYPNLAVTGDPDQSIYGWRGADLNNILEFEHDYPGVRIVRLERNYRSTKRILRIADELIGHNLRRKQKALWTENDEGAPVRLALYADQDHEAAGIAEQIRAAVAAGRRKPSDFAIFYRVNALSRVVGAGAAAGGRAVPDGPRPGVLRPQGNQGRARLLPAGEQPARRHGVRADGQHAAARHRQEDDRPARSSTPIATACRCWKRPATRRSIEGLSKAAAAKVLAFVDDHRPHCGRRARRRRGSHRHGARSVRLPGVAGRERRRAGPEPAGQHRGTAHRRPQFDEQQPNRRDRRRAGGSWKSISNGPGS